MTIYRFIIIDSSFAAYQKSHMKHLVSRHVYVDSSRMFAWNEMNVNGEEEETSMDSSNSNDRSKSGLIREIMVTCRWLLSN